MTFLRDNEGWCMRIVPEFVRFIRLLMPVWKFCHDASQAPTRKNRAPNWVSRQDQTANETPNPTKAYLMAQFGSNLAPFIL